MSSNKSTLTVGDLMPGFRTSGANCWVYFDPENMRIYESTNIGNGTPMRAWHGVDITLGEIPIDTASTENLEEMLSSMADSFAEMASEHEIAWNGSNHVGRLTERGEEIYSRVEEAFSEAAKSLPSYWDASQWFNPVISEIPQEILKVGSLSQWADNEIGIAQVEGAHLDRDDVIRFGQDVLEGEAGRLDSLLEDDPSGDDEEDEERRDRLRAVKAILEAI